MKSPQGDKKGEEEAEDTGAGINSLNTRLCQDIDVRTRKHKQRNRKFSMTLPNSFAFMKKS